MNTKVKQTNTAKKQGSKSNVIIKKVVFDVRGAQELQQMSPVTAEEIVALRAALAAELAAQVKPTMWQRFKGLFKRA
jgi:hypothetical protein